MKIAVATSTRSEYSLNRWIIKNILEDPDLDLQLLVGGSHFSPVFGQTYKEIEEDGIKDYYKVEFTFSSDSAQALTKSVGVATISVAQIFAQDRPDFLLINGDRYELFAFVIPAMLFKIPIGHIGGGEITEGAIDDEIRHSITKMSHLHFVACKEYARNVSLLGEEDWRIHVVGAEGLENINRLSLYDQLEVEERIGLKLNVPTVLVTYHPAIEEIPVAQQINTLLTALEGIDNLQIIFTAPGVEVGSDDIINAINNFTERYKNKTKFFTSLGGRLYLSLLKHVKCIIGNSSSGIYEAPSFNIPTVNIGNRQKGRIRANSVIDVGFDVLEIKTIVKRILDDKRFVERITRDVNPFGDGVVSSRILKAIKESSSNPSLMDKKLDFRTIESVWNLYY